MTGKIEKKMEQEVVKVTCPGCDKVYRVPKDSLPAGKKVTITCPKCKSKMEVADTEIHEPGISSVGQGPFKEKRTREYFDAEAKVALVACRDPLSLIQIEKELKAMGFENRDVATGEELNDRFKFFAYPLVILSQRGPDMDAELKRMLDVLSKLPKETRRKTFVVYIHLGGNRFDTLQAFSMGVDLTLSPLDLTNLSSILESEMAEKQGLLRPYFEVLKQIEGSIQV